MNQSAWRPHMVRSAPRAVLVARVSSLQPHRRRRRAQARVLSPQSSVGQDHPAPCCVDRRKPTQPSDQSGCARGVTLETIVHVPLQAISPSRLPLRRRNPCNEALSSAIPLCAIRGQLGPVGSCASGGCTAGCLSSAVVEAQPGQFLTRHQMFPAARACIQPTPTQKSVCGGGGGARVHPALQIGPG